MSLRPAAQPAPGSRRSAWCRHAEPAPRNDTARCARTRFGRPCRHGERSLAAAMMRMPDSAADRVPVPPQKQRDAMPRTADPRKAYLELHGRNWRVVVFVPAAARRSVGATKLVHKLETDSLREANVLKQPHVARFKRRIEAALASVGRPSDEDLQLAVEMSKVAREIKRDGRGTARLRPGRVRTARADPMEGCSMGPRRRSRIGADRNRGRAAGADGEGEALLQGDSRPRNAVRHQARRIPEGTSGQGAHLGRRHARVAHAQGMVCAGG